MQNSLYLHLLLKLDGSDSDPVCLFSLIKIKNFKCIFCKTLNY